MPDTSILEAYEAQKAQALNQIAQTLQQILVELRNIRAAQQTIAAKTGR